MKRLLYILTFLSALISADSYAQAIYTYTSATNGAPSFTANNTIYSNLTAIGTGGNTPCGQGFSGITGFTNAAYNPNGPVVSVLVKPNACYKLNITGFQAGLRRSGTGPAQARLVYSIDGGATWVLCPTVFSPLNSGCATSAGGTTNANWTTSVTVTSSTLGIIFRICPYGATNTGGTLQIWGLNIYGTVTPCAPTLTPVVTDVSCNGGSDGAVSLNVLNGCNPYTYTWTGPNSYSASTQNITGLTAGTYSVTVSSPGGCSSNTTAVVNEPLPLTVTATNNGPLCSGENLNLFASSILNATYSWAGPNSFSANTQNPTINGITAAGAGTYTVTATQNGCMAVSTTTLVMNPSPSAVLGTVTDPTACGGNDGSILLTGLAPISVFTLNYTKNGVPQNTTVASDISGNIMIGSLGAGTYDNITVTLGPCVSNTLGPVVLSDPPLPATPVANANTPVCSGAALNFSTANVVNATYSWTGPNSFASGLQNPVIDPVSSADAGNYYVTVSVNNCVSLPGMVTVVVNPLPVIVSTQYTNPTSCGGANGTMSLTGLIPNTNYSVVYDYNTIPQPATNIVSDNSGVVLIAGLATGTYDNITVTINGCVSNVAGPIIITNPAAPVIAGTTFTLPTTCGGTNGTISLTGLLANTSYSVEYDYNTTPQAAINIVSDNNGVVLITGLATGTYGNIAVTLNGCVSNLAGPVVITDPAPPVIGGTTFTQPTSCGGTSGTISLTGLSANTNYSVEYDYNTTPQAAVNIVSDNNGVVLITGLATGTYENITVTLNGCVSATAGPIVITDPAPPAITGFTSTQPTFCGGADGTISLSGLMTNMAYTVNYDFNGTPQAALNLVSDANGLVLINGLIAGNYTNITVALNSCVSAGIGPISIADPSAPVITAGIPTNPTTCNGTDGFISLTGLLANTAYSLNYSFNGSPQASANITADNSGVIVINALVSGTYDNITLTLNGCNSNTVGPFVLTDPPTPTVTATTNAPICEGNTLNLNASLVNNAQYSWVGPGGFTSNQQNPVINNGQIPHSGTYIVTVMVNNCTSQPDTVEVLVAPTPMVPVISNNGPLCAGNDLHLTANNIAGATFNWSGPNAFSSNDQNPVIAPADQSASGTYNVFAQIGTCISGTANTTVVVNPGTAAPVANNIVYCQDEAAIPLTATGQGLLWYTAPSGGAGTAVAPTPATTVAGITTYYVSQTLNNCESPRASLEVMVRAKPPVPVADSVFGYCQDAVAATLAATGQNILWYSNITGGTGVATAPTPQTSVPGIFKYYVTQTIDGCESDRKEIAIAINTKPSAPIADNRVFCTNEVATVLTASGTNLLWYTSVTGTVGSVNAPLPSTLSPDSTVWFVTQTVNGCESDKAPLTVLVHQQPSVQLLTSKDEICQYETAQFSTVLTVTPQTQYEWTVPESAEIVSGGTTGTAGVRFDDFGLYQVSLAVNNQGCIDADTFVIKVREAPKATVSLPEHACAGDEIVVGLGYVSTGVTEYEWNFDGATVIDSRSNAGPYTVRWTRPGVRIVKLKVSDSLCGSDRNIDSIHVHYLPDAAIKPVKAGQVCVGDEIKVEAYVKEASWEYSWAPEAFFQKGNGGDIQYPMVRGTGNIYLTITTEYGCVATDSVFVETQPCCSVYFPTAFSPNGDGRNDVFRPVTDGNHDLGTFVIVNRWGQIVFETVNNREGWDGKRNSQPLDIGVYYYYYKYKCEGKILEEKGEVTLVR